MLNQTGITRVSAMSEANILLAPEVAVSFSCKVNNTGVSAGTDGKKIILAGTPLWGDLTARDTAFTATAPEVEVGETAPAPVGVILHDVDVTGSGDRNAQVTVFGFVDLNKVSSSVETALKATTPAGITLVK